jgi:hypothetical protein
MPADAPPRAKTGRPLRQPLVSMAALALLAVGLVLLLLRLGAWS